MPDQATQITGDITAWAGQEDWVFDIRQVGSKVWFTPRENSSAGGATRATRSVVPPFREIEFDFDALIKALDPHIHRVLDKAIREDGVGF